jgi:hypothetical protein
MTAGQHAMGTAMLDPEPGKGGRGKTGAVKLAAKSVGFSDDLVTRCRAVIAHSRALAAEVIADRMPLDSAIKQMQRERQPCIREFEVAGEAGHWKAHGDMSTCGLGVTSAPTHAPCAAPQRSEQASSWRLSRRGI